jgi:hypothetical protein
LEWHLGKLFLRVIKKVWTHPSNHSGYFHPPAP